MNSHHTAMGISVLALTVFFFAAKYFSASQRKRMPARGWIGLVIILGAEILLALHWNGFFPWDAPAVFLTPIVWTGYLLLVDAMVWTLEGRSVMSPAPGKFWVLAGCSIPLWLIFEAYNLRLENWTYVGLPSSPWLSGLGYAWSFATIWPAIFETADLVRALGILSRRSESSFVLGPSGHLILSLVGLIFVLAPVVLPSSMGQYLFGAVWVGFIFLLDPLLYRWKGQSFLLELEHGERSPLWSFLLAGAVCGILWEFWNYWAAARWVYIFPIGQSTKIFEMPLLGYLGFPAFALECRVMYEFLHSLKTQFLNLRTGHTLETAGS